MYPFFGWISENMGKFVPIIKTIVLLVAIFLISKLFISFLKRKLMKKAKTKKQASNVEIFSNVSKYVLIIILILAGISSYSGSWAGFGLGIGLFSAALGWALQKPITGIAAWVMIVTKRPFDIGDRVIVGNVRGDVVDITLSHIYVSEIGGLVAGEEISGRIILIPNSVMFEQNIINYTSKDEYILDQVSVTVTYESDLDKAMNILLDSAKQQTKEVIEKTKKQPYIRTYFGSSGMSLHVRYFAPVRNIQEISSSITKRIYDKIKKEKDVEIAYPHTDVLLRKNKENLLIDL